MFLSLLGFGFSFQAALPMTTPDVRPEHVARFAGAVTALVMVQVVGHIGIALLDRRPDTGERDRLDALRGARNASSVLATGAALCTALLTEGNFLFTHVPLAAWVLAQLVETGPQLFSYGREGQGASGAAGSATVFARSACSGTSRSSWPIRSA